MRPLCDIGDIFLKPLDIIQHVQALGKMMEEHHGLAAKLYHAIPKTHFQRRKMEQGFGAQRQGKGEIKVHRHIIAHLVTQGSADGVQ